MELKEILKKRRMVRDFRKKEVPVRILKEIIAKTVLIQPSAGNTRPQKYTIIKDKKLKRDLSQASFDQEWVAKAPALIVVSSDTTKSFARYGVRGLERYSIIDSAFSSMLIHLQLIDFGLSSCFVGALDEDLVRGILNMPLTELPIGIICIGYGN